MSHEFLEVHEYWRLCVRYGQLHSYSIWIPMSLTKEVYNEIEKLDAKIYRVVGTIEFSSIEDMTVFRLRTGV